MTRHAPDEFFLTSVVEQLLWYIRSRPPSTVIGRCTRNDDPKGLRRIKVQYHWGREDGEGEIIESSWIHQITTHGGPTKSSRQRVWGNDYPLPEIGQEVALTFNNDDPHDPLWFGVMRYGTGETQVPGVEKDDHIDWSARETFKSGGEVGWDTEGNFYQHVAGNYHLKVDGSLTIEVRGVMKLCCLYFALTVLAVLRMTYAKLDSTNWLRADHEPKVDELLIETMRPGGPVRKDPGIGKVEDLNE